MRNETRATEVSRIVQALSSLPGGTMVDVSCKKLPRLGPAESGDPYQMSTQSFDVRQVPTAVAVLKDAEEVIIRLRGALGGTLHKDLLAEELEVLFEQAHLSDNWDVRVNFRHNEDRPPIYELTVFSHSFTAAAEWTV